MSFNKYYIPGPIELVKMIKELGPAKVVNRKIDAIVGSSESIRIFEFISELMRLGLSESDVTEELSKKYPNYFGKPN